MLRIPDVVSSGRSFGGQAGKVLFIQLHLFFTEVLAAYGCLRFFGMSGLAWLPEADLCMIDPDRNDRGHTPSSRLQQSSISDGRPLIILSNKKISKSSVSAIPFRFLKSHLMNG